MNQPTKLIITSNHKYLHQTLHQFNDLFGNYDERVTVLPNGDPELSMSHQNIELDEIMGAFHLLEDKQITLLTNGFKVAQIVPLIFMVANMPNVRVLHIDRLSQITMYSEFGHCYTN